MREKQGKVPSRASRVFQRTTPLKPAFREVFKMHLPRGVSEVTFFYLTEAIDDDDDNDDDHVDDHVGNHVVVDDDDDVDNDDDHVDDDVNDDDYVDNDDDVGDDDDMNCK